MAEHIDQDKLQALYNNELSVTEQIDVLTHMGSCDFCTLEFDHIVEQHRLLKAPVNMKDEILARTTSLPVTLTVQSQKFSKRVQLLIYSMKISTAVVCTLLFLGFINMNSNINPLNIAYDNSDSYNSVSQSNSLDKWSKDNSKIGKFTDASDKAAATIQNFTNNLLKIGGNNDD